MLFVESVWRGKDDLWGGKVQRCTDEVNELVSYCNAQDIPTVFWNKEDPYHFDDFMASAKLFDFVFTTDIECIPRYKEILGHDKVYLLPFACQPKIHNPVETYRRKDAFVFAGAYYAYFSERNTQFASMVKTLAREGDVDIFDRNYNIEETKFKFPEAFRGFIRGGLAYDEINKAYKGYKYAINLNSMTESPTMFSRRVFELMASNTIVLSNYTIGTQVLLGDLVISTDNMEELEEQVRHLNRKPIFEKKIRLAALRKVMMEHTAQDRLGEIASKVFSHDRKVSLPHVTCVAYAKERKHILSLRKTFLAQSYQNKSMVLVYADDLFPSTEKLEEDESINCISESDREKALKYIKSADYIAGLHIDDYYGENYLIDLVLAARYSEAGIITKSGCYEYDDTYGLQLKNDINTYQTSGFAAARSSLLRISKENYFNIISFSKSIASKQYIEEVIFAVDEFNYCKNGGSRRLNNEEEAIINDLQKIDTGININEKWIAKNLRIIEYQMEKREKLVNSYKEKISNSQKQNELIEKQENLIKKMDEDVQKQNELIEKQENLIKKMDKKQKQLNTALDSLITVPLSHHPVKKIKSYKKLVQIHQKLYKS